MLIDELLPDGKIKSKARIRFHAGNNWPAGKRRIGNWFNS